MNNTAATPRPSAQIIGLIKLIRPKQWIKNGFVLAPLMFSGAFLNPAARHQAILATILFCLAASATYIVNDICDIERDRRHPKKAKSRPLATGQVLVPNAVVLLCLIYLALALSWLIAPGVSLVILCYLLLNLAYTFVLKNQPVIDIFVIAIGFVLRVWAGAVALNVPISGWMFTTTLSLALYLAAVKRGQELSASGSDGRRVLERYTKSLVDRYAEMSATCALVFYSMFVMSSKPQLVITVPLVLFGLFRYWFVVDVLDGGESPTDALLKDWPLLLTVAAWVATCMWAVWPT
jgi:4-hydroxybenzoate polyprenyltransferase